MAHNTTLLVADGEAGRLARLTGQLEADELPCREADSPAGARAALETGSVGLALLGRLDGAAAAVRIVRALRGGDPRCDPGLPAIVLGQSVGELELLRAFEAGCDDYVSRDVGYLELRARERACTWRTSERARPAPQPGRLARDRPRHPAGKTGRPPRAAHRDGVRPARPARPRPGASLHQARAAARRVWGCLRAPKPDQA
jgi:DNA-binding response OmpR family regulator